MTLLLRICCKSIEQMVSCEAKNSRKLMAKFIVLHQLLPTHNKIEELTNELLANKFRLHIYTESSRKKT